MNESSRGGYRRKSDTVVRGSNIIFLGDLYMTLMEEVLQWKSSLDTTNINNNFDIMDVKIEKNNQGINFKNVLIQCKNGHNPRWMRFTKLKQGQRCAECTGNIKYTIEHFQNIIKNKFNNEWEILSDYNGIFSKLILRHKICGHTDEKIAKHINEGRLTCRICNPNGYANTKEDFMKKFILRDVENEYVVLGEYINATTKIEFLHKECGKTFLTTSGKFLFGAGCPYCISSKGEKQIRFILDNLNISYQEQYKFKDCKNINYLPFDFALFIEGKLIFVLEYMGKQHYTPFGFGEKDNNKVIESFESMKERDKIKEDYCKNNNIPLYQFHYKDFKKLEGYIKFLIKKYSIR